MAVSFLDLKNVHEPLLNEFTEAFRDIVNRSAFVNGPEVKRFEEQFSKWVGTSHCIGLSSGLDAETIGFRALGLQPGDQVVAPAMTFIATVEAIHHAGGVPYLVDVDSSGLMDMNQLEEALKKGVRFAVPVHLFGQLVDPEALISLKNRYGLKILEDACQSHGAKFKGYTAGTIGDAAAFSFYPGKNLGALGDAGALCTNNPDVDKMVRCLREHGQTQKYHHSYEGYTARIDTLQAAFLSLKLPQLNNWTKQRITAASYYAEKLNSLPHCKLQSTDTSGRHVYHLFVLLTERRSQLAEQFKLKEIGFGFHYPIPIHQLDCYKNAKWNTGHFPNAEKYANQGISLPMYPGITQSDMDQVIEVVRSVCS